MKTLQKTVKRVRRHKRVRTNIHGTAQKPRLSIYRSNTRLIAQLVNDDTGTTLLCASSSTESGNTQQEKSIAMGTSIAEGAKKAGIAEVVFDRGGNLYSGNIKACADAARKAGLKF